MMLLGIFLHVACAYCTLPDVWWFRDTERSQWWDAILLFIHLFRMPVFMVMAGFFGALLVARRGTREFARNRVLRIGLPLLLGVSTLYPLLWAMSSYGRALDRPDAFSRAWYSLVSGRWLQHIDTTHLWFLNYLLWLYAIALVVPWAGGPVGASASRWFAWSLQGRIRFVVWPVLTFATLCTMSVGLLDTRNGWIPAWNVLLAYAVFFAFGWMLYGARDRLGMWTRGAWTQVLVTLPLSVVNLVFTVRQLQAKPDRDWTAFVATAATGALVVWLMIFGLTGLFLRYFDRPSGAWRYLADSSYWQYVMHAPVVLFFQLAVARTALPSVLKCAFVTVLSAAALVITYDLFARSTWIGVLLSGRRYPRVLTIRSLVPQRSPAPVTSIDLDPAA
jgi:glucan biosynthesis protein C